MMVRYIRHFHKNDGHSPRVGKVFFIYLMLLCSSAQASIATEWKYSKATSEVANGNYTHAQGLMQSILVDEPNRPDLLYDLGIASFKNKEYSQAAAYFSSAAEADACPPRLQEQSYFNLGNTSVELNQLNDAIVHYQKVLELNEKNEQAQHNLEVVKKMLEEQEKQKQQDQQDKEDQKEQEDQKDPSHAQDRQDGQNGDDGDNEQDGDKDESKNDSSKKNDDRPNQKSKQKNKDGKGNKPEQNKEDEQGDSENGSNEKKQDNPSRAQDRRDGKDKKENPADKKEKQDSSNQEQSKRDDSSSAKASEDKQNKQIDAGGQKGDKDRSDKDKKGDGAGAPSSMQKEPDLAPEDRWILQVLSQRENDEKKTNKQLIRTSIDKKLGGQHGQNCW